MHRPSRFDRVWTFELPDQTLRRRYLDHALPGIPDVMRETIAGRTSNWSFAYLNELKTTASIMAAAQNQTELSDSIVMDALELMVTQYEAGRKLHALSRTESEIGFGR